MLAILFVAVWVKWEQREPHEPIEIFQGITYGCERLDATAEGSGLVHWVRIDLTAPGIDLFVTPLNPAASAAGWQYRLERPEDVLQQENLAVVINATLFSSNSGWFRRSGDFARSVETVVADHQVSHFWEHTYLLWFDNQLTPHLKPAKPPQAAELTQAKWGIGGQGVGLSAGVLWAGLNRVPDARTAVAIDGGRKLLFLAVGASISPRRLLEKLAALGARTACCSMGVVPARWRWARQRAEFSRGYCWAVGGRWRPASAFALYPFKRQNNICIGEVAMMSIAKRLPWLPWVLIPVCIIGLLLSQLLSFPQSRPDSVPNGIVPRAKSAPVKAPVNAPESKGARLTVPKIAKAPTIDGKMDPGEWQWAAAVTGFMSATGDHGGVMDAPNAKTYLAHDGKNFYMAVYCELLPGQVPSRQYRKRDDPVYMDSSQLELWLTPPVKGQLVTYQMIGNAYGAIFDTRQVPSLGNVVAGWNGRYTLKSTFEKGKYWSAELSVPFADFGVHSAARD